jgi:hypothetical protein
MCIEQHATTTTNNTENGEDTSKNKTKSKQLSK